MSRTVGTARTRRKGRVIYEVETRTLEGQHTAVRRRHVSPQELPSWLSGTFGTIAAHLQTVGVPAVGPPVARLYERGDTIDVEAGYVVAERVTRHDEVEPSRLPDGPAAATWHRGDPHAIDGALEALEAWCEQQGVEPAGPPWATYHAEPGLAGDPDALTEVVQPYRPA